MFVNENYENFNKEEEYQIFIIEYLIKEKKSLEVIKETLNKYGLFKEENIQSLKKNILEVLNFKWNTTKKCWVNQISFLEGKTMNLKIEYKNENVPIKKNNPYKTIKIPQGIKIPEIATMEVACAFLSDENGITVSSNDAETIMKNIAAIESKLNEIVRVINKIGNVVNEV